MDFKFDVEGFRKHFPSSKREHNGEPVAYLDAPGGSQVPLEVSTAVSDYLLYHNANEEGLFDVSRETDAIYEAGREALADFLGCAAEEVPKASIRSARKSSSPASTRASLLCVAQERWQICSKRSGSAVPEK